jgi:hypothetical protein
MLIKFGTLVRKPEYCLANIYTLTYRITKNHLTISNYTAIIIISITPLGSFFIRSNNM